MNTVVTTDQPPMMLDAMASRAGLRPQEFADTVRKTCGLATATAEEFAAFLLVAKQYDLNPILREIYAFPRKGGGIVPILSLDGWVSLINRHPQSDGFEFEDHHDSNHRLVATTCRMFRKDRSHPVVITEYLAECIRPTEPWKMPHRMLRHKAMIQAARYCFGFAGVFDEDEGQKIADIPSREIVPAKKLVAPPPPPIDDAIPDFDDGVVEEEDAGTPLRAGTGSAAVKETPSPNPPGSAATKRASCIERAMEIATDRNLNEDDREAELNLFRGVWIEDGKLPDDPDFVRQVFDVAGKVARKEQTEAKARFFLSTLMK